MHLQMRTTRTQDLMHYFPKVKRQLRSAKNATKVQKAITEKPMAVVNPKRPKLLRPKKQLRPKRRPNQKMMIWATRARVPKPTTETELPITSTTGTPNHVNNR